MTERNTVRRGYAELEGLYAVGRAEDSRGVAILDQFLESLPHAVQILDAGCGPGVPILRAMSANATVIGLDFSREQLRLARKNAPQASLLQAEMTALPIRDDTVDAVTAYHSLIHVPFGDHQTVIDEFARVLQPGGRLLLSEGPDEWSGSNPDWLANGVEMQWSIAGADATRRHLQNAGFTVTDEWDFHPSEDDGEHWILFAAQLES